MKKNMYFCTRNKKIVEAANKNDVMNFTHCNIGEVLTMEELFAYLYCQCNLNVANNDRNEYGSANMPTLSISPANYNKIKDCATGDKIRIICDDEPELVLIMGKKSTLNKQRDQKKESKNNNIKSRKNNRGTRSNVSYSGKELREQAIADGLIIPADASSHNISRDNYSQETGEEHKGWTPSRSEVRSYV